MEKDQPQAKPDEQGLQSAWVLAAELLKSESVEVVAALAAAAANLEGKPASQGALEALRSVADPAGLDAVWGVWYRTHSQALAALLVEKGQPARAPLEVHVRSCLLLDLLDELELAGAQMVAPLLGIGADPQDPQAAPARQALGRLKSRPAQEELCRWVIEHDHPLARAACLEHGYYPHPPLQRALFFILTEQWEQYQALDFDARLLKAVYAAVDPAQRRKIAEAARRRGWVGFVEAAAARRTVQRLGDLSQAEWEVIASLLSSHQRYAEMWELAQASPPVWAARLLRDLMEAGWQPGDEPSLHPSTLAPRRPEGESGYIRLRQLASECLEAGLPNEYTAHSPRLLEGHRRLVTALAFSPQEDCLVSAGADKLVQFWRLPQGVLLHTLDAHTGYVSALSASPDGFMLASGSGDRTVRLWRMPSGEPGPVLGGHAGGVTSVVISPTASILASADQRVIWLWRVEDGKLLNMLKEHTSPITSLAFTPDGKHLVSCDEEGALHIWDAEDAEKGGGSPAAVTLMERVGAWSLSPDGSSLFTASKYGVVRQWSLPGGEAVSSLPERADGRLLQAAGGLLAASHRDLLRIWHLDILQEPLAVEGSGAQIVGIAAHPHAALLAWADGEHIVRLWQGMRGGKPGPLTPQPSTLGHTPRPQGERGGRVQGDSAAPRLMFSPGGNYLAVTDGPDVWLWQMQDMAWLYRTPAGHLDDGIMHRSRLALENSSGSQVERAWFGYALELAQWRHRFDIEVAPAPRQIQLGEFDIEIESAANGPDR